jgi:DNA-binding transcriptional MerR regulator
MKDLSIKKLYYSISEVSKITDLEQYVLRYWETEFEELKPQKNRAGNRIYISRDIKLILYIKKLLREERYTIEGAKQILKSYEPNSDGEQLNMLDKDGTKEQKKKSDDEIIEKIDISFNNEPELNKNIINVDTKKALIEIKELLTEVRDKLE